MNAEDPLRLQAAPAESRRWQSPTDSAWLWQTFTLRPLLFCTNSLQFLQVILSLKIQVQMTSERELRRVAIEQNTSL